MFSFKKLFFAVLMFFCVSAIATHANNKSATIIIDKNTTFQRITGFGGFVNSPQFAYNHMTTAEIRRLWGKNSEMGYNIMRIYLPVGESNWSQSLATAKLAKELGLILFASPWSPPAEWKTNGMIAGATQDANGNYQNVGSLKVEHYEDYAHYLNNYVKYLRNNGVELDGISIQNEPDYTVTYAGCRFTPAEMATFIKNYGHIITCPIIAAEGVGITDNYANALMANDVIDKLGIFGGHQYGAIQTAHKNFRAKGKEVWMTEFLINWNANKTEAQSRNYDWKLDAFDFADAVNTCMLSEVNAWVHYAAKRYYGMMGDGTRGIANGVITKRGYILSHFAKYVTGTTRIQHTFRDDSNVLKGSSYVSVTGDSVVVMVINSSDNAYDLTFDLPFYTKKAQRILTTTSVSMSVANYDYATETLRPKIEVPASSVTTYVFVKNSDRPASFMTGAAMYHSKIETQSPTTSGYGTAFRLSGTTRTFKHDAPLLSQSTSVSNGYLALSQPYNRLLMNIRSLTSAGQLNSDNTTLHYVDNNNTVVSQNFGKIDLNRDGMQLAFDLSRHALPNGCKGLLRITNSNFNSVLTLNFGDVFFVMGNEKMYKFGGIYGKADSELLNCIDDRTFTALDFSDVTQVPADFNLHDVVANKNMVFVTPSKLTATNTIHAGTATKLHLADGNGDFFSPVNFVADEAIYDCTVSAYALASIPFDAQIPTGLKVFSVDISNGAMQAEPFVGNTIPAHTVVLLKGNGNYRFVGSGNVSSPLLNNKEPFISSYIAVNVPVGSYAFVVENNVPMLRRITATDFVNLLPFRGFVRVPTSSASSMAVNVNDPTSVSKNIENLTIISTEYYDLMGAKISSHQLQPSTIYLKRMRMSDGSTQVQKVLLDKFGK